MGGAMAWIADSSGIQFKMLNTRKGAAVQAIRAQCDRARYRTIARTLLDREPNLFLRQGEVVSLSVRHGRIEGASEEARRIGYDGMHSGLTTVRGGLRHIPGKRSSQSARGEIYG